MAKKPGLHKRFDREAQRQALWEAWAALTALVDEFTRQQADRLFEVLQQAVGGRAAQDAAHLARLGDYDERAYDHYIRLMNVYRETLSLYEQHRNKLSAYPVKSILEGIYSVLGSRLKQFEDSAENNGQNPVSAEKDSIFLKTSDYVAQHIGSQARLFAEHRLPGDNGCNVEWRRALLPHSTFQSGVAMAAADYMQEVARDFCFRGIYAFYRDGLRFCLASLNDLPQRKAARYYVEILENEKEVLSSIIKIQVKALEFAVERSPSGPVEKAAVHEILTLLREGYQYFSRAATDIQQVMDAVAKPLSSSPPLMPYEEFEQSLQDILTGHKSVAIHQAQALTLAMDEKRTVFLAALDKETDALFEQIRLDFYKTVYRFQRIVSEEVIMADEMTNAFEKTRAVWPPFDTLPPEAKSMLEILHGIAESVNIKIESLKESINAFNENGIRLINEYAAGKRNADYDDVLAAYNLVLDQWMAEMQGADKQAAAAFFDRCQETGVFLTYRQYYEKRETEYAAKIEKALFSFKKETLLYEISTYEEILTYSVSRLRDSEWEPVQQAVSLLDETWKSLEVLLKKNNIQVIQPKPHDPFNGREHEVLMAEKQEGFNKGEVIKPLNSGYRQKDIVILRANVIAAR